jgi:hypothetical protein
VGETLNSFMLGSWYLYLPLCFVLKVTANANAMATCQSEAPASPVPSSAASSSLIPRPITGRCILQSTVLVQTLVALASRPLRKCVCFFFCKARHQETAHSLQTAPEETSVCQSVSTPKVLSWQSRSNSGDGDIRFLIFTSLTFSNLTSSVCINPKSLKNSACFVSVVLQALHSGSIAYWCYWLCTVALSPTGVTGSAQWLYRLLTFSNHQIGPHFVQSVSLLSTPKAKCKSIDRKQALVQLRCLQWRQHKLEGNWNSLRSSLSLNAQNAIRSACKSEAWVGSLDHHKAQRSAARFVQGIKRAVTVCDELHTAGYNKDCCSIVWNTKTSCSFLICLLVFVFWVFAIN